MMLNNSTALLLKLNVSVSNTQCDDWHHAQHVLYQLANLFLAASLVIPGTLKSYWLLLRSVGSCACVFLALWGYHIVCQQDVFGWYLACAIINGLYTLVSLYSLYPAQFDCKLETLYEKTFRPIKMSRAEYKMLTAAGSVQTLTEGAEYCTEGATQTGDAVSILLTGRLQVTHEETYIHHIEPNQFIDSIEYDFSSRSSISHLLQEQSLYYQMTVSALEESTLITWSTGELRMLMMSHPVIRSIFNTVVGKDITIKLYQVQEMLYHVKQEEQMLVSSTVPQMFTHANSLSYVNLFQGDSAMSSPMPSPRGSPGSRLKPPSHGQLSLSQSSFETCV